jgi:hypothetical protein
VEESSQVLDPETQMCNAERFGHRLEAGTGASRQEAGSAVIQRAKTIEDNSTKERIRRANERSRKRLSGGIKFKKELPAFRHRAWQSLMKFEENKAKSPMVTSFGPVNLSKFPTKDPGAKISTVAKDYGKQSVGHRYSHLVDALGGQESQIASELLTGISSDTAPSTAITSGGQKNAAAKMLAIAHVSEERRFGGSSKMFRAVLRMVRDGKVSMKAAFTGDSPLFPMAKNPTWMRRLLNLEGKKQRKPPPKPPKFDAVGGHMSDSSDDEG